MDPSAEYIADEYQKGQVQFWGIPGTGLFTVKILQIDEEKQLFIDWIRGRKFFCWELDRQMIELSKSFGCESIGFVTRKRGVERLLEYFGYLTVDEKDGYKIAEKYHGR